VDQNLNNSMAIDLTEITIPMSLRQFAKRERFEVGFDLLVKTFERMENAVSELDNVPGGVVYTEWVDKQTERLKAYAETIGSIIESIKGSEKDE